MAGAQWFLHQGNQGLFLNPRATGLAICQQAELLAGQTSMFVQTALHFGATAGVFVGGTWGGVVGTAVGVTRHTFGLPLEKPCKLIGTPLKGLKTGWEPIKKHRNPFKKALTKR